MDKFLKMTSAIIHEFDNRPLYVPGNYQLNLL